MKLIFKQILVISLGYVTQYLWEKFFITNQKWSTIIWMFKVLLEIRLLELAHCKLHQVQRKFAIPVIALLGTIFSSILLAIEGNYSVYCNYLANWIFLTFGNKNLAKVVNDSGALVLSLVKILVVWKWKPKMMEKMVQATQYQEVYFLEDEPIQQEFITEPRPLQEQGY